MAVFNGYPATYQNPYMVQAQPQQPQNGGLLWVQGEAAAKSYLVAPNSSVVLWDSEAQTVYIKSADASGMPSIKTLDYTIREMPQNKPVTASDADVKYLTKDDLKPLYSQISALKKRLDDMKEADDEPAV